ncbi:MAG TPA: regulatory protein RecX [Gemmatimonadaceae bacterium]|nr:regulatory protein RecX [Gemmatimonadaceae bacterium]
MTASAYEMALRLLEYRARSAAELRRQLLRKGAEASDVDAALSRLREQKLIDDEDFALQFARGRITGAGASRRRIVQELARNGIPPDMAGRAIDTLRDDDGLDPSAGIHRVARRKWQSLAKVDEFTRKRRLYAFLARRGYDPDEIRAAMQSIGEDVED